MEKKTEETIKYYTAYLCGVLDTLVRFSEVLSAADCKAEIKEVVESIVKDCLHE